MCVAISRSICEASEENEEAWYRRAGCLVVAELEFHQSEITKQNAHQSGHPNHLESRTVNGPNSGG